MITERSLRKWRKESLLYKENRNNYPVELQKMFDEGAERVLRLTQELLDQHLIRKG